MPVYKTSGSKIFVSSKKDNALIIPTNILDLRHTWGGGNIPGPEILSKIYKKKSDNCQAFKQISQNCVSD